MESEKELLKLRDKIRNTPVNEVQPQLSQATKDWMLRHIDHELDEIKQKKLKGVC